MNGTERFSSRWGLIVASLGMAVGAGNIWRFPRVAAQHGGGAFMLAWVVALFCWSIPLLIIEFSWGKKSRTGPIGAFVRQVGSRWGWAGAFVAVCCTAIMFYYAVVTGWCLYYFCKHSFVGLEAASVQSEWQQFAGSGWAVVFLVVALSIAVGVVLMGVRRGIERVCKVLVPALFVLLVVAAVRALLLPGAAAGLEHLFRPNFHLLLDHQVWLEAFSQSAWSTGAGWGLYLVYAGYARKREDVVLNAFITGLGNNAASLLAALAIVPAIFALLPPAEATAVVASGNEGLAFVWIPRLFLGGDMLGGGILLVVFFAALSVAALSSLIAMVELGVRTLVDLGMTRNRAAVVVGLLGPKLKIQPGTWVAYIMTATPPKEAGLPKWEMRVKISLPIHADLEHPLKDGQYWMEMEFADPAMEKQDIYVALKMLLEGDPRDQKSLKRVYITAGNRKPFELPDKYIDEQGGEEPACYKADAKGCAAKGGKVRRFPEKKIYTKMGWIRATRVLVTHP
ncbi:sodium-dependent transporter, partial [Myxococcota bacterium]